MTASPFRFSLLATLALLPPLLWFIAGLATRGWSIESQEWVFYLLAVSSFSLLARAHAWPRSQKLADLTNLAWAIILLRLTYSLGAFDSLLALFLCAIAVWLGPRESDRTARIATLAIWLVAQKLLWWRTVGPAEMLLAIALTAFGAFCARTADGSERPATATTRAIGFACVLLIAWTFPFPPLPSNGRHHWSYYTEPIALFRQGFSFFHTLPSQYGFLSIALPGYLTPLSPARALWVCNLSLTSGLLALFYFSWRPPNRRTAAWACLATVCLVLLLPGFPTRGFLEYPSVGAYRFGWAILLGYLLERPAARGRRELAIATLTIGSLWSIESAAYCWCSLVFAWGFSPAAEWRRARGHVVFGGTLAAAFTVAIALTFRSPAELAHFAEFATAYVGGFGALPAAPDGMVWLAIALAAFVLVAGLPLAACTGWCGLILASATYAVSRSHEATFTSLVQIWALGLLRIRRWSTAGIPARLAGQFLLALTVYGAAGVFTVDKSNHGRWLVATRTLVSPLFSTWTDADFDPTERHWHAVLLRGPSVDLTDYLTHSTWNRGEPRYWLPIAPAGEFRILPESVQRAYLATALRETPAREGWLLRETKANELYDRLVEILPRCGWRREASVLLPRGGLIVEHWRLTRP